MDVKSLSQARNPRNIGAAGWLAGRFRKIDVERAILSLPKVTVLIRPNCFRRDATQRAAPTYVRLSVRGAGEGEGGSRVIRVAIQMRRRPRRYFAGLSRK